MTRLENIKTLQKYAQHLTSNKYSSFLPDITGEIYWSDIKNKISPPFHLEKLEFELIFDGKSSDLKDVFNQVEPDEHIPYGVYTQGDEFFAKIYEKAVFFEEWLKIKEKSPPNKEEIFFRIQSNEKSFICWTCKKITFSFVLSEAITLDNITSLMNQFKTMFIKCVKNNKVAAKISDSNPKIVSLAGRFSVLDFILEPEIFSAYVTNDVLAQKYLFFDEYPLKDPFDLILKKIHTIHTKKNITVFFDILTPKGTLISQESIRRSYTASMANPLTSVRLTITSDRTSKQINVRVFKVSSIDNINTISRCFTRLIERLKTQREDIITRYKKIGLVLPVLKEEKMLLPLKHKPLWKLQRMDKLLFINNYSRICQQSKQPTGIEGEDETNKYLTEHHKFIQNKEPPFKLKYSYGAETKNEVTGDNWYVCVPPNKDNYIYPYLIKTQDSDRPYVPCCGMDNKKLKNWLQSDKTKEKVSSSIMQPDKILKKDVRGELPLGIKAAWDENIPDLLRLGVEKNPKSFMSCLSRALSTNLSTIQNKLVKETKNFRTQETFGYTSSQLEKIIQNKDEYVDPCLFLGLAQNAMDVQIFLYSVTKKLPKGDIARPRTAFAYLPSLETFQFSLVIVIHQDTNPPQCELIIRRDDSKLLFEQDDPLVKRCKTILLRSSRVFTVAPEKRKKGTSLIPAVAPE